jgi:hypothetical protein
VRDRAVDDATRERDQVTNPVVAAAWTASDRVQRAANARYEGKVTTAQTNGAPVRSAVRCRVQPGLRLPGGAVRLVPRRTQGHQAGECRNHRAHFSLHREQAATGTRTTPGYSPISTPNSSAMGNSTPYSHQGRSNRPRSDTGIKEWQVRPTPCPPKPRCRHSVVVSRTRCRTPFSES